MKQMIFSAVMALAIFIRVTQVDAAEIHHAADDGKGGKDQTITPKTRFDVDRVDKCGNTALMYAANKGHLEIVKELLAHNADVNRANNHEWGNTPLMYAANKGHLEIVKELLAHNADVNRANNHGGTPLMGTAIMGHSKNVKELLAHNADVSHVDQADGYTALMYAAGNGKTESVNTLLPHYQISEVLAKGKNGKTALDIAKNDDIKQLIQDSIDNKTATLRAYTIKSARK